MKDASGNELAASSCDTTLVGPGTISYCQSTYNNQPVETANCGSGSGLSQADTLFCPVNQTASWPDGLFGYGSMRRDDTYYLFNDYVRVGVNTVFGGTIFELYGTDMRNRILEAGGGALQLSLYAGDPSSPGNLCYLDGSTTCQSEPLAPDGSCPTSGSQRWEVRGQGADVANCRTTFACNGVDAGFPWNPVESQSVLTPQGSTVPQCVYDPTSTSLDSVKAKATLHVVGEPPTSTALTISRKNPYQFSKNLSFNGLTWTQTVTVLPNVPYVKLSYTINWLASSNSTNGAGGVISSNHELPALFLKQTFTDPNVVFSETTPPYSDPNGLTNCPGTTTCYTGSQQIYLGDAQAGGTQPYRQPGPNPKSTEGWASVCDSSTPVACFTVATFLPNLAIEWKPATEANGYSAYLGIYGNFNLGTSYSGGFTVYAFPYNYTDVVNGLSIRQWINNLANGTQ